MVGRKDGLMRFHKISPCPKCGGKVKAKWEEQHYLSALVFRCGGCRYKPYVLALKSKPAVEWEWPKDMMLAAAIYDYEQAPAKCLYTTKDAADQLYGHYGEETEVEE